jgi:hypothetical protein
MGPALDEIKAVHEEFWRWIFREDDSPNHPSKISGGGMAQTQHGSMLIIAGSLPDGGAKNRSLQIDSANDYIFVPADACLCTVADGDGQGDQELINQVNSDMANGTGIVSVNGNNQNLNRLAGHAFTLNIQKRIAGTGKSRNGEGFNKGDLPGQTRAAAACLYAIIRSNTLKSGDMIRITGRQGIDVTYSVR